MIFKGHKLTIGVDLGDRWPCDCVLDEALLGDPGSKFLVKHWERQERRYRNGRARPPRSALAGRLVVSGAVYAELLAEPERNEEFVDRFFAEVGIAVEWEFRERIWRSAGEALQKYAERRRKQKGTEARRILADFLIGAHALASGYKLLTLDERMYRAAFSAAGDHWFIG